MKKVFLSAVTILSFGLYALQKNFSNSTTQDTFSPNDVLPSTTPTQQSESQLTMPQMGNMGHGMMSGYLDGAYTGDNVDAYYGLVQVKVTIANGKITDVTFLKFPNDRHTSVYINSQAMPYLQQEAISAQSAKVDLISGATQTSIGFRKSLQSALNQAI
jgi:uncharacterized protein with FMN-binding domain